MKLVIIEFSYVYVHVYVFEYLLSIFLIWSVVQWLGFMP